ncbi:arsenate reductase family protein [Nocardia sp. SYP-A9097]|uniref:arsenate reductase family protein n=1 Tax=Nocardia sp. SYP-A9097 TaxID=2663237 RepID=UPI00129A0BE8|nr:arsenate reductase family protein [Nocardia sp. SYP-A9097]MRH88540.1 arsenate reductase family protein [Nocardia sp. SYP-A9097]
MATEIWHNPKCSKSRTAKAMLDDTGVEYVERRYLDNPPSTDEIRSVLTKLALEPWDITRTAEPEAKELGISAWGRSPADRERWIDALATHPRLIQRPIVLTDDGRAILARSDDTLDALR